MHFKAKLTHSKLGGGVTTKYYINKYEHIFAFIPPKMYVNIYKPESEKNL